MTTATIKKFSVHVAFVSPAWDEVSGLDIEVWAKDRDGALKAARREMRDAGHSTLGGLRYTSCRASACKPVADGNTPRPDESNR